MSSTWYCRKCMKVKPDADFPRNARSSTGLHYYCRECHNAVRRAYQRTLPRLDPLKRRLWAAQREQCAICHQPLALMGARLDVDKPTGAARGVLCRRCTTGLWGFGHRAEVLTAASAYVMRTAVPYAALEASLAAQEAAHATARRQAEDAVDQALAGAPPPTDTP